MFHAETEQDGQTDIGYRQKGKWTYICRRTQEGTGEQTDIDRDI